MANKIYLGDINITTSKFGSGDTSMYIGATKVYPLAIPDYLAFEAVDNNFTFQCTSGVSYSTNGSSWTSLAASTSSPSFNSGDTVYIKSTNTPVETVGSGTFSTSGMFNVKGNPLSIIYGDNFDTVSSLTTGFEYDSMFKGCTGLTSASGLTMQATTLANYSYVRMFSGCTNLTDASFELPASTITDGGYKEMFRGCTSLTAVPIIRASTAGTEACNSMFRECTSLTTAPTLSATTLAQHTYLGMFKGCTSLTAAPSVLPATILLNQSYYGMFDGCTSLTAAPTLSATTLASRCCMEMFKGCTSLTTAPVLSASTLESESYRLMFSGCTSLNSITCLATDISASACTTNWVLGVASSGTFYKDSGMTSWTTGGNGIPTNWVVKNYGYDQSTEYLTFEAIDSGTFKLSGNSVDYSVDNGSTWTSLASNTSTPTVSAGNKIMFKATLTPTSSIGIGTFSSTGRFNAMGNPMSLLYGDNFVGQTSLSGKSNAFYNLFSGCTGLTSAENLCLPATTLDGYCYNQMFLGCTGLTTAPALPATTLAVGCYKGMFLGCNFTTAPELPATTLASYCYQFMFEGCKSLTTAPTTLPATKLANRCYQNMFNGCTNLNSITCLATNISASYCTSSWVSGVAANGTFTKDPTMTSWTSGSNGIPNGWTVQDYQ